MLGTSTHSHHLTSSDYLFTTKDKDMRVMKKIKTKESLEET